MIRTIELSQSIQNTLLSRHKDRVRSLVDTEHPADGLLALSPNDLGVIRNGGRRGTAYAPEAIVHCFTQLSRNQFNKHIAKIQVAKINELKNFSELQANWCENLLPVVKADRPLVHIGGGHDHILPLLLAIDQSLPVDFPLVVINVDAHLDTRIDSESHSGTPFRQFANLTRRPFHVMQVGIHEWSNPVENYNSLSPHKMSIFSSGQVLDRPDEVLDLIFSDQRPMQRILSLDCDVFAWEGVSAVNPQGLPERFFNRVIDRYLMIESRPIFGIYEYNPLYDNLSQKGARTLSTFIHQFFKGSCH